MKHLTQDALDYGSDHYQKWLDTYDGLRLLRRASH